jgi:hypothetical protein
VGTLTQCQNHEASQWLDRQQAKLLPVEYFMVTFKYVDSKSGQTRYRTLKGEDFLWLVLQHVLPKGFRRVRDYGFLHGNARKLLALIQLTLKIVITAMPVRSRPVFSCPKCQSPMQILAFIRPAWSSG